MHGMEEERERGVKYFLPSSDKMDVDAGMKEQH